MKNNIRNQKKFTWVFKPPKNSKLKPYYKFKYKKDLIIFLNKNFKEAINGSVSLNCDTGQSSGTHRRYVVWFNRYDVIYKNHPLKIILKQAGFRGRKYVSKFSKVSKNNKKHFAFSDKIISLMCRIEQEDGTILEKDINKLVSLFYKSGFKDFEPDKEQQEYIDFYIKDEIPFSYWSDRCNYLRMKTIIEYFKQKF